jgi:hypothetical protein
MSPKNTETMEEFPFRMHKNEKKVFIDHISRAKNYLEFGVGGSTLAALEHSDCNINSVDTDEAWIKKVRASSVYQIAQQTVNRVIDLHYVDIGKTKDWGFPLDTSNKETFIKFSQEVFTKVKDNTQIDFVLIDGRFRVACALFTIYNLYLNQNLKIAIHNFIGRPPYQVLKQFLDIKYQVKTLAICTIKDQINFDELLEFYHQYKHDPR